MSEQTTCSAVISFAEKLERKSSEFYEKLAEKDTESKGSFSTPFKNGVPSHWGGSDKTYPFNVWMV